MARLASGRASRTARMTAAIRYRHWLGGAKPLVFADREAGMFLDAGTALLAAPTPVSDWAFGRLLGPVRGVEGEVLARARYVDEAFEADLADGLDQMIVLGAGFDTSALRHNGSGCRFFEVDHPATQGEKRATLARKGLGGDIAFVAVDFATDDLAAALLAAGFDPRRRALVSWLGVTMYLAQQVSIATLATLRTILAPGSGVIFDAFPRDADLTPAERPMFAAMRAFTATRGEPMTGWDSAAFASAIAGAGYQIAEIVTGDVARKRWFAKQPAIIHPPVSALFYRLRAI
jgi:methyltransferase (TIGR00027 family)